jgi:hydroxymethylpyrimidine pyrophosphatase-like HAD family hydrolase
MGFSSPRKPGKSTTFDAPLSGREPATPPHRVVPKLTHARRKPERPTRETHVREVVRAPPDLVVTDVDGTLLTDKKELSAANLLAVRRLSAAGISFTLVSARPPTGLIALARSLDLSLPYGACNGAAVCSLNGRVFRSRSVPRLTVPRVLGILYEMRVSARVFLESGWFVTNPNGPYVAYEANTLGHQPHVISNLVDAGGDFLKITGASDEFDQLRACEERLRREVPEIQAVRSRPFSWTSLRHL